MKHNCKLKSLKNWSKNGKMDKKKVENWKKWKVKKQIENCAELKNWKEKKTDK